ncbi:unnamed protein product [Rotaria sordida]|uniref:Uncharacterized protein n=2 Tax=Rotaria sordida TaxID=392033 RepID=A0A820B3D8_9BILA|nr:unnamed protein product [Rotaria sordida]CAF4199658.1 unnamed protein product [Rotaria sordida]
MKNMSVINVHIYAVQTLDRYHLNKLNISFDNSQIVNLNNEENNIEQWTVGRDIAFHIGRNLTIIPHIKDLCVKQAKQLNVTIATLIGFYPMAWTILAALGSLIDLSIGITLVSFLTFTNSISIAIIVAPIVGLSVKNYPKYYRQRINRQQ